MAEQLISTAEHDTLPDSYVRPETHRPRLCEVVPDAEIPVVDLADPDRAAVVAMVAEACRTHGFFQVLNNGVPEELTAAMMSVAYDFFRLPAEAKAKLYSDDPGKKMRLSTSFNVRKETVHNWRDYLRLHCHPLEQYVPDWPANPPSFRAASACMWKKKNIICRGSTLPRWSGGSGPSCLLPVVSPSQRQPGLGKRSGFAASAPRHRSQRRCSALPESTIISVSEIPLGDTGSFPPPTSLSSASSSLDTATTRTPFPTTGENAAPDATASGEPVRIRRSGSPPPEPPAPPASAASVAKTTVREDAVKVLLVIIGANITILMNIKDIKGNWKTEWKVVYGIFMTLSLVSTVISLFTAMSPGDSWGTFSGFCARFGLLLGTPLFIVYLACQLGNFGCAAGVPTAALIVLLLGVIWWNSARPATDIGTAPDSEPRRSTHVGGEEWIRDHEATPL